MQIDMLYIKNYRGLDIKIEGIQEVSIVIGQNDSGKTHREFIEWMILEIIFCADRGLDRLVKI